MTEDFYGRGAAYPLGIGAAGGVVEAAGQDKIEQSIRIILGTQHGQRVMRPTFGCNLQSLVFAPNSAATANLARYLVESGLRLWEPRIDVSEIDVSNDYQRDALAITVGYRVKGTQEFRSLVFAFALEQPS